MKTYRIYQVDAFTKTLFEGNPAGVVANADGLSQQQMQAIARELNNAETAFILSPTADDHDVWIRFFTPTTEVPICGHATISAHYVRALENDLDSCTLNHKTGAGVLPVEIIKLDSGYRVVMTQGAVEISGSLEPEIQDQIIAAMGLAESDRDPRCPMQISSTGHSKVMIGINSRSTLNELQPDMLRLSSISRKIGCNGYYVFTYNPEAVDYLVHGRMFAPAIGIPEDPVTGNANGPVGAYLVQNGLLDASDGVVTFKGMQGEAIGRPGTVTVTVTLRNGKPHKVQVGGEAVVAFKTEIML